MLHWRVESGVDDIRDDIVSKNMTVKDFPYYDTIVEFWKVKLYAAYDKEGNPVCWDYMGEMDPAQLLTELTEDQVVHFYTYNMEYRQLLLHRLSVEQGRLVQVRPCDHRGCG